MKSAKTMDIYWTDSQNARQPPQEKELHLSLLWNLKLATTKLDLWKALKSYITSWKEFVSDFMMYYSAELSKLSRCRIKFWERNRKLTFRYERKLLKVSMDFCFSFVLQGVRGAQWLKFARQCETLITFSSVAIVSSRFAFSKPQRTPETLCTACASLLRRSGKRRHRTVRNTSQVYQRHFQKSWWSLHCKLSRKKGLWQEWWWFRERQKRKEHFLINNVARLSSLFHLILFQMRR